MSVEHTFEKLIVEALKEATKGLSEAEAARVLQEKRIGEALTETVPVIAEDLADQLVRNAPEMLAERAGPEAVTREQVRRVFGPGLDLCEMLLRVASETGEEFTDHEFGDWQSIPILPYTLGHLLARACRIAEEVLLLLKNGWGLGAYARWRAMHEVEVFAAVIAKHGDETARRFVEHRPVQRWRTLRNERVQLGEPEANDPILEELRHLDTETAKLRAEFGRVFLTDHGWAAEALGIATESKRGPSLADIQRHAGYGHLKRHYREASASVHPVPAAVLFPDDATLMGSTLLTAPSLSGLVTPAHAMCLTLTNVTAKALMSRNSSFAGPFVIKMMSLLSERAGQQLESAWDDYVAQISDTANSDARRT